jgi:cytochrome c-type biogenesis protein CcmH/NrfG
MAVAASHPWALGRIAADTYGKHGLAWLQAGRVATGHDLLDEASRIVPRESTLWLERGSQDLELAARRPDAAGVLPDAVASFEHVTRLAPRNADGWANLGVAQLLSGSGEERDEDLLAAADGAYRRALELRPRWPELLVQHAGLASLRGDEELAREQLARARALSAEAEEEDRVP